MDIDYIINFDLPFDYLSYENNVSINTSEFEFKYFTFITLQKDFIKTLLILEKIEEKN